MNAHRGFTLLEVLAVVAIVAVLAGILIPGIPAARATMDRARTKVMFNQWALACAQFRQEYGFLPALGTDNVLADADDTTAFLRALTGRNPDGSTVADPATLGGNLRRLAFHTPAPGELRAGRLTDAFGNTEFGAMIDRDGDGWVRPDGSDGPVPAVHGLDGRGPFVLAADLLPPGGVQADVIFFSAGRGRSADDLVTSWP
jgi:prepilin-type N-terminal cleavage/methylation domain-containing protein